MRNATVKDFIQLYRKLRYTDEESERAAIIAGLACATNVTFLRSLLETTLGNTAEIYYRSISERQSVFNYVLGNGVVGTNALIQFVLDYWLGLNVNEAIDGIAVFVVSEHLESEVT